jgi:hypothetical protein
MRADSKWTVGFEPSISPFSLTTEKTTLGLSRLVQRLEREQQRESPRLRSGRLLLSTRVRHASVRRAIFFSDLTDPEVQNRQAGQTFVFRRLLWNTFSGCRFQARMSGDNRFHISGLRKPDPERFRRRAARSLYIDTAISLSTSGQLVRSHS